MSAIEQPAARSGSTTVTRWPPRRGQLFRAIGEDVGRFGHEVDAAKGDRPALGVGRRQGAELVAVAAEVGQGDDFVLLIMMAEDRGVRRPKSRRTFSIARRPARPEVQAIRRREISWEPEIVA